MREIAADAWEVECDVLAITTNGTVMENGANVMGGGIAKEAALRNPTLPFMYGSLIERYGHHVYLIPGPVPVVQPSLLMFPTKDAVDEPASLQRIEHSIYEANLLANLYKWETIALPRPGAGLGGLDWEREVKPCLLALNLSDRFLIVSFPEEA